MEYKTGELERVLSVCAEASIVPDAIGQTALFYAVQRASDEEARQVAERLVSVAGIDAKRKDFGGQSPLFYAAAAGNVETVKFLLSQGCDADEKDNLSQTPLFYTARDGRMEVADLLLKSGANAANIDRNGQTPLFYAARENRRQLIDLLLAHGASAEHVDVAGRTAAYFARLANHVALAEYLDSLVPLETNSKRKRCRLVFVDSNGATQTPTPDQLEWIEARYPEICVWSKTGPVATGLVAPAIVGGSAKPTASRPSFPKKKAAPPPAPPKPVWMTVARQLVSELFKKEDAWIFLRPVDPVRDMCPDYLSVIREPMDLGTIRKKMAKYASKGEFLKDMDLVFSNCKTYNKPGTLPEVLCTRVEAFWRDLVDRYSFHQIPDSAAEVTTGDATSAPLSAEIDGTSA